MRWTYFPVRTVPQLALAMWLVWQLCQPASAATPPEDQALLEAALSDTPYRMPGRNAIDVPLSERGRVLFAHDWMPEGSQGDGLGPVYNERSCIACHEQGGPGGGGKREFNVDLLTNLGETDLSTQHAGFGRTVPSIVLHRYGTDARYEEFRSKLLGDKLVSHRTGLASLRISGQPTARVALSHRNTPALFGAGLIDKISVDVLIEESQRQAKSRSGVAGKVPATADGRIGLFGWRGQTASLQEFVLGACSNEVGLQVVGANQPIDPVNVKYKNDEHDLSLQQTTAMVAYVASLAAPPKLDATSNQEKVILNNGGRLFHSVGCVQCHLPQLGEVKGIYSDLLLHDMGEQLADPVTSRFATSRDIERAMKNPQGNSTPVPTSNSYYFGGPPPATPSELIKLQRHWRTPPLWGVRASAPYLHDGRASNLLQAILLHGGEAQQSVQRFRMLPDDGKERLITFVYSLGVSQND